MRMTETVNDNRNTIRMTVKAMNWCLTILSRKCFPSNYLASGFSSQHRNAIL